MHSLKEGILHHFGGTSEGLTKWSWVEHMVHSAAHHLQSVFIHERGAEQHLQ